MIVRVRGPDGTLKIECQPSWTLGQLASAITDKQVVALIAIGMSNEDIAKSGPPAVRLSLNRKDELPGSDLSINELGIRGGDLLHLLAEAPGGGGAGAVPTPNAKQPKASWPPPKTPKLDDGDATRRTAAAAAAAPHNGHGMLVEMGFASAQAAAALRASNGSVEEAVALLSSEADAMDVAEPPSPASTGTAAPGRAPAAIDWPSFVLATKETFVELMTQAGFALAGQPGGDTQRFVHAGLALDAAACSTVKYVELNGRVVVHALPWDGGEPCTLAYAKPSAGPLVDALCPVSCG